MKPKVRRALVNQSFEEKIRKVGELIPLAARVKAERSGPTAESLS